MRRATAIALPRLQLPIATTAHAAATTTALAATRTATTTAAASGNSSSGGGSPKRAPYSDPDMTHFRATATPHPLFDKATLATNQPPVAAAEAAAAATSSDCHVPPPGEWTNPTKNAVWSDAEVAGVQQTHKPPADIPDKIALFAIKTIRLGFDVLSGYLFGRLTPTKILRRTLFLETVAGIPGMVAGTLRHLESLRRMKRDHGWIHTLLEEAENERMHMLVFMHRHNPGLFFRGCVLIAQGVFWNLFFFTYLVSPRVCHRFVGYLEEEAVRTYTHIIDTMNSTDPRDQNVVDFGLTPADQIAIRYWRLREDATMKDVMMAVRADEANHRDTNHTFANMKHDETNPYVLKQQQQQQQQQSSAAAGQGNDHKQEQV